MAPRLNYRRHNHYATASNRVRRVRTPGSRVVYHNVGKQASRPKCANCHRALPGIPAVAPHKMKLLKKKDRTVHRAYGGSRCHACVRERKNMVTSILYSNRFTDLFIYWIRFWIMRAFLVEEQKCVKQVLQVKEKQKKDEMKAEAKKSKPKKQSSKTK